MKKALFLFLAISSFNIAKAGDGKFKEKMKDFLKTLTSRQQKSKNRI